MVNKCLIKKIKGSFQNENLPIYGILKLKIKSSEQVGCYFRFTKVTKVSLINATFSGGGTEKTIAANTDSFPTWTRDNTSSDSYLIIHDKYSLVRLDNISNNAFVSLSLEDFKYCDNLISILGASGVKPYGDFSIFNEHLLKTEGIINYDGNNRTYDVERMLEARYASVDKVGFTISYCNAGDGPKAKGLFFGGYELKFGNQQLVATIANNQVSVTAKVWENGVEKTITGTYNGSSWVYA